MLRGQTLNDFTEQRPTYTKEKKCDCSLYWDYAAAAAAAAKSLQSCPTLCDPTEGSPPGSPIPGILQARTLEWVAISFSNARKWKVKVKSLSPVWLLATPWTAAYQAPPSMGFSRQEYWSGLPLPSPLLHHRQSLYHLSRSSLQFSCSIISDSLWPHELQHTRPSCPSPTPGVYPNPCPLSRWCHPTISSSVVPCSSCPQLKKWGATCEILAFIFRL